LYAQKRKEKKFVGRETEIAKSSVGDWDLIEI
jgi:hypothetical protein